MKKDLKDDLWRIYVLVFLAFVFFSSCKCMFDLLTEIPFLHRMGGILLVPIIALHIGSGLLILSGRLKDKD